MEEGGCLTDIEDSDVFFAEPVTPKEQEIDKDEESEDRYDFKYNVWLDEMEYRIDWFYKYLNMTKVQQKDSHKNYTKDIDMVRFVWKFK